VGGFALSGDGHRLAYVASDSTYSIERQLFDPATGETKGPPAEVLRTTMGIDDASPSPDGTLVVFSSMGAVQEDIFLVQADGSKLRHLTDDAARDRFPSFFSDGKRIVFQSDRGGSWDLWSIAPDGSGLTQLTRSSNSALDPIPSPDSRRIAATNGEDYFIFDLDEKGGLARERKLPRRPGIEIPGNGGWVHAGRDLLVSNFRRMGMGILGEMAVFSPDANRWEPVPAIPDLVAPAVAIDSNHLVAATSAGVEWRALSGGPTRRLAPQPKDARYTRPGVAQGGSTLVLVRTEDNADIWMATPP
jgi:hypothetical protein